MDKIYFGSGAMLLFKYPLMKRKEELIRKQVIEDDYQGLSQEEINTLIEE